MPPARTLRDEGGFTLVELMIVVLIIGILVAIALPTFLGSRTSAQDAAAQSALKIAERAILPIAIEDGQFGSNATLLAVLPNEEASIAWVDHTVPSTRPTMVSIDEDGGTELNLAARSDSGTCFYLRVVVGAPSTHHMDPTAGSCEAHDYQGGPDGGW